MTIEEQSELFSRELTSHEMLRYVQHFIDDLIARRIRIDYERFGDQGLELAKEFERNMKEHTMDDYCYSEEENYRPRQLIWLYHFIMKAIAYGALEDKSPDKELTSTKLSQIHEDLEEINNQLTEMKKDTGESVLASPKEKGGRGGNSDKLDKLTRELNRLAKEVRDIGRYKADMRHLHRKNKENAETTLE